MAIVSIHGASKHGEGVGRLEDGRVVFVEGALPGDKVRIELLQGRKQVLHGRVLELIQASPGRVESRCQVTACGGCAWRAAELSFQAAQKRQMIVETMRRVGRLDVETLVEPIWTFGTDGWMSRHRVRLHAFYQQPSPSSLGGWRLGYMRRRSHQIVGLVRCPTIWPELEQLALTLAQGLATLPAEAQIEQIDLAYSRRDARGGICVHAKGLRTHFVQSKAWLGTAEVLGFEVNAADGRFREGNLELRYDHQYADHYDLRFEAGLFTQALPQGNDALVTAVKQQLNPHLGPVLLELHAGIGNFSIPLARTGARVVAYEINQRAAALCERNARAAGTDVHVHARADTHALHELDSFDAVLLDPPRTGCYDVVKYLAKQGPRRVVYVSCDVATLARDAAVLTDAGYQVIHVEGFDLFPQTPHVETLMTFIRPDEFMC